MIPLVHTPAVCSHLTLLPRDAQNYLVRVFANPPGELEEETGQPWKPYFATVVISVRDRVGEVMGVIGLPKFALPMLRAIGRSLGLFALWWQSWDERTRTKLKPVFLEL